METPIYFDNAATTRPHPKVVENIFECLKSGFGNPSSSHPEGVAAKRFISDCRQKLANIFSLPSESIIFCSSGTECNNLAIKGVFGVTDSFRGEMVTTCLEHASVLNSAMWLKKYGVVVHYVKNDSKTGQINLNHLEELITTKTKLLTVSHVNGETGIIQDLSSIVSIAKTKNPRIIVHSDGVQAFAKIPVNLQELGVDLYSISGHKFHSIKGAGALIRCKNFPIQPLISGGGQEFGFRSGTENVIAISSLGIAAELALTTLHEDLAKITQFSNYFRSKLKKDFPMIRLVSPNNSIPHILTFSIPNIPGEVLLHHLAEKKIYVGTGSACNENTKKLSPTLIALRFTQQQIKETLRLSFSCLDLPKNPEKSYTLLKQTISDLLSFV